MPFIKGITALNAQDKLQEAKQALTKAVNENASNKQLEELANIIVNIETTIKSLETRQRNNYDKLSPKEKLIVDAQKKHNEELYEKEKREREEREEREKRLAEERIEKQEELQKERWNSIHDSVVNVGTSLSKGVNELADKSFHALLGPLNLLINPLEKALNFNLFDLGKKTAVDILTLRIRPLRNEIEKKGGLIGATGIFIADTITKVLSKKSDNDMEIDLGDSGNLLNDVKSSVLAGAGVTLSSGIVKAAKWLAPVTAGLAVIGTGVYTAWKNHWDEKGPEIIDEINSAAETPEFYDDFLVAGKKIAMEFFGGIVNAIKNFSDNKEEINKTLFGSEKPENIFQSAVSSAAAVGKGELDTWAQYSSKIKDYVDSINNPSGKYYTAMEALKILDPYSPLFDEIIDAQDFVYTSYFGKLEKFARSGELGKIQELIRSGKYKVSEKGALGEYHLLDQFGNIVDPYNLQSSAILDSLLSPKKTPLLESTYETLTPEQKEQALKINIEEQMKSKTLPSSIDFSQFGIKDISESLMNVGKSLNDAIITKNNDVFIPDPDDNIILTKDEASVQPSMPDNSVFQNQLISLLKEITNNLRQPTIINNMSQSGAMNFEGFRL